MLYKKIRRTINLLCLSCISLFAASNVAFAADSCGWPGPDSLAAVIPVAAADGSYASGVVVGKNKVLTAAHAISPNTDIYVRIHSSFRQARLLMRDSVNDLAILSVNTENIMPLRLAMHEPRLRQQVWAVGFPRAQAKTTSVGVLQKKLHGALHASAPIDSGQSGGGLLLCDNGGYALAGMLRGFGAYLQGGEYVRVQNHSVSVAAATIQRFVDSPTYIQ